MRPRTLVAVLAAILVAFAFALERFPPAEGSLLAWFAGQEIVHLVAHTGLYGALAVALGRWWFPSSAGPVTGHLRGLRAVAMAACFVLIAATQELVQALHRGRLWGPEEMFDLFVDGVAACLGLIVWTRFDRGLRPPVAQALGLLLHPVIVGPVGVFALVWSATRALRVALGWTLAATLALAPIAALWVMGLRRGWFSDRDLSLRRERPGFLGASVATAGLFAAVVCASGAPSAVQGFALAGLLAAGMLTAVTALGLKASGHAAVPVGVVVLLQATSLRGLWPFAVAALAVSWARVAEGRHSTREVAAGWSIAGASALVVRHAL